MNFPAISPSDILLCRSDPIYFAKKCGVLVSDADLADIYRRLRPSPHLTQTVNTRTLHMSPRQFGITTAILISALHSHLFDDAASSILVLTRNETLQRDYENRLHQFLKVFLQNMGIEITEVLLKKLSQRVTVRISTHKDTSIRGLSPSIVFADGFDSLPNPLYFGNAKLHVLNSGFHESFHSFVFNAFEKYHITRDTSHPLYGQMHRYFGSAVARREILCKHPNTSFESQ